MRYAFDVLRVFAAGIVLDDGNNFERRRSTADLNALLKSPTGELCVNKKLQFFQESVDKR